MKTAFLWGWKDYTPQPDPLMTRQRAARLFRSWRRSRTQGRRDFSVTRLGLHHYRIAALNYYPAETAVIQWRKAAS